MKISKIYKIIIFLMISFLLGSLVILLKVEKSRYFNILLITLDNFRFDHLGCYGYKKNISPNIDDVAQEGVLFTYAFSHAPWTWPAVHSLITSTYPSTHGVYFWEQVLPEATPTLINIVKQKKYSTAFISGHPELCNTGGPAKEFDTFDCILSKADEVTQKAIHWLQNNHNKKFFLWVHYMDMHDKLLYFSLPGHSSKGIVKEETNSYTLEQKIHIFDETISYIDSQIAVLLSKLKAFGLYNNTIIIITADHGQGMGEHHSFFTHSGFLWDSLIRVPLIISCPKVLPKNKIIMSLVQHIDIVPTICDILKMKKPKTIEGESLLSLIQGKNIHSPYVFSEHKKNKRSSIKGEWFYTKFCIRSLDWKLIYTHRRQGDEYELYNLKADPQEQNNLIDIEKEEFKLLKAKLEEWMNRPKPAINPLIEPLSEEAKKRLRGLGYLQ